jgi:signal transduction histidine kinase
MKNHTIERMTRVSNSNQRRLLSARQAMLRLLIAAMIPALLVQGFIYYKWYETRLSVELHESLELARAVALTVRECVQDVRRQAEAAGAALVLMDTRPPEGANALLRTIDQQSESVGVMYWADPQGVITASSVPNAVGFNISKSPYYQAVSEGKTWAVSDLVAGPTGNEATFVVACGIREHGVLKGVVIASVETTGLEQTLASVTAARETIVVYDKKGVPVFRLPRGKLSLESWVNKDPLLREALAGHEAVGETVSLSGNQPRLGARVPVAGLGWVAGVSRPSGEVFAPLVRSLLLTLGVILVVLLASAAVAFLFGRLVIRDVRALQAHARAVGRGDLDHVVHIRGISELRELADAYEEMAARRKKAEADLVRTAAELIRSNHDLEQFASVASHDLQEPLRMVTGYLQLIEQRYKDKLDADGHEFIGFAVNGARRMQQLINDLLAYARVDSRGKPFEPTDCNQVLEDVLANLTHAVEQSGAAITHDPLPTLDADATQLAQLFQNLIGNAIKFRGAEPPRIHVGAQRKNGDWQLSVSDNGIGIEARHFERIFAMFQRLHTAEQYPGTGIGLAICKKIVERHGGQIWVESEPGKGSTFHFTLAGAKEARS